MKQIQSRKGNVVVLAMICVMLVMFFAAMILDVGLVEMARNGTENVISTGNELEEADVSNNLLAVTPGIADAEAEENRSDGTLRREVSADGYKRRRLLRSLSSQIQLPVELGRGPSSGFVDAVNKNGPQDIIFVVDLSGSMNDDTETAWATQTINDRFANTKQQGVGERIIRQFYADMSFGSYPGTLEYIGQRMEGVPQNSFAYHAMTRDNGQLAQSGVESNYRILKSDTEQARKVKAYKWMIDKQIATLMPQAKPAPDSDLNYEFWEKYLDYIMVVKYIGPPEKKRTQRKTPGDEPEKEMPTPGLGLRNQLRHSLAGAWLTTSSWAMLSAPGESKARGWIPPNVDEHRIYKFNNPNRTTYPKSDTVTRWKLRNRIGYRTYAQFLLDWGRDGKPDHKTHVQSSVQSSHCPYHSEVVNGEQFLFPPRTEPMNTVRRSLISALQVIRDRNQELGMTSDRDLVAVMTFDAIKHGTSLKQPLTDDYDAAMDQCRTLQATSDDSGSTATDFGLMHAFEYLRPIGQGGVGRQGARKVVILLTDGQPTAHVSANTEIEKFVKRESSEEGCYGGGYFWLDAALMQSNRMRTSGWSVYPIGVGFGANHDFLDRLSRFGNSAHENRAIRVNESPTECEQAMARMFGGLQALDFVRLEK